MRRLDLISNPRADKGKSHHVHGFLASCIFHGLGLSLVFALAVLYHTEQMLPKSGSAPGTPSITLEKMIIVSQPPPPQPSPEPPPIPMPNATAVPPQFEPAAKPVISEGVVPILAIQTSKPAPPKTQATPNPAISRPVTASSTPSSYAPGVSVLPHPPYPVEARDRGQTGTVLMNVHFNTQGGVELAEVAQSSGVPLLDSETRSFIRAHWHSPSYAGQTISVPVQYTLQNL